LIATKAKTLVSGWDLKSDTIVRIRILTNCFIEGPLSDCEYDDTKERAYSTLYNALKLALNVRAIVKSMY
jgi:hypothetical protein